MLIGLTGRKNCGKNFVADQIRALHPCVIEIAFADTLKTVLSQTFDFSLADIESMKRKDQRVISKNDWEGWTMRELLQHFGMAIRNTLGAEVWINSVLPEDLDHTNKVVVVTDIRMNNEAQRVKDLEGVIWKVIRDDDDYTDFHITEMGIATKYIDMIVENKTKEGVQAQLKDILNYGYTEGRIN